ncbi:unnamed protein product, partial [Vitis vinifera]
MAESFRRSSNKVKVGGRRKEVASEYSDIKALGAFSYLSKDHVRKLLLLFASLCGCNLLNSLVWKTFKIL